MTSLARLCYRRRWIVIGLWLATLILGNAVAHSVGAHYVSDFNLSGTDTQKAFDLLKADFPTQNGDVDQIVIHARTGKVTDPGIESAETVMLAKVAALPHV